jgi:hypothetical protein
MNNLQYPHLQIAPPSIGGHHVITLKMPTGRRYARYRPACHERDLITMNVETVESAAPDLTTSGPLPEPPRIADPLPLGLTGFGVSVLLLSLTQAGLIAPSSLPVSVLAISLTAGGLVHIIAGVLHFVRGEQGGLNRSSQHLC